MPIGPARLAEPHPGVAFDWTVLGIGFVAIVALLRRGRWPCPRGASPKRCNDTVGAQDRFARRPSSATRWATAAGTPPDAAIGIGYAVDPGRGRTAVPTRGVIVVTALAVAAIAATATFGTNLSRLVHTPRLYGQSWDLTVDAQFSPLPTARIERAARHQPGVTAWTFGTHADVTIGGRIVPGHRARDDQARARRADRRRGPDRGRPDEIALGTKTLADLHRQRRSDPRRSALPRPGTQTPPREATCASSAAACSRSSARAASRRPGSASAPR